MKRQFVSHPGMLALLVPLVLTACTQQKFSTSPEKPVAGTEIRVKYSPLDSLVRSAESVDMEYSIYSSASTGYERIEDTRSVKMQKKGKTWVASVTTPPITEIAVVKFLPDNSPPDNNNGEGYFIRIHNDNGEETIESQFGHAVSYVTWATLTGYVTRDYKRALELLTGLIGLYPDKKAKYARDYLGALRGSTPDSLKRKVLTEEMEEILESDELTDSDYQYIIWLCKNHEFYDMAAATEKTALEKFPDGAVAQKKKYEVFAAETDIFKQMEMVREVEKKIPARYEVPSTGVVFANILKQQRFDLLPGWWKTMDTEFTYSPTLYGWLALQLINEKKELELALEICERGDKAWKDDKINPPHPKSSYLTEQRNTELKNRDHSYFLTIWAKVLRMSDRSQEAVSKYEEAFSMYPVPKFQAAEINEYAELVTETKMYDNAAAFLEESKKAGIEAAALNGVLKEIWMTRNGSDEGFGEYLAVLEAEGMKEIMAEQKKKMINEAAPDFSLVDLAGNTVRLSDYRSKVVIVDFWATWCGPCKASFPAVQKVVDRYSPDDNVKFLFIDTRETAADKRQNAINFLEETKYTFHVLLDNDNKVYESYRVSGIPTKFVIDGKGKIRFNVVGVSGTTDEMIQELVSMIELAKN
jgi:thiol-disulfide isomerase/thioredoxin